MGKKFIYWGVLFLFAGFVFINPAFSQEIRKIIDCEGTLDAWKIDLSLKDYMRTHDCTCPNPNASPVCTPKGSGSTPFVPSGRLSPKQQMSIMMMQNLLQPLFNAIFQNIFSPPDTSKTAGTRKTAGRGKKKTTGGDEKTGDRGMAKGTKRDGC